MTNEFYDVVQAVKRFQISKNRMRPEKPWVFTNLKTLNGLDDIIEFIRHYGMLT